MPSRAAFSNSPQADGAATQATILSSVHHPQHTRRNGGPTRDIRMSGLILKLAPGERVLINGAVIENGDRRSRIAIKSPNANILRLKEAIHPDDVATPVARVCYAVQLVLSGDADGAEGRRDVLRGIEQLSQVFSDRDSRLALDGATDDVIAGNFYQALRHLRTLLPREARLFAQVS